MNFDSENISLEDSEIINSFYQLATLASLLLGKKLNLQNLFILLLTDEKINKIAKEIVEINSDIELCRFLLLIDPTLVKSKLILSFTNNLKKINGTT